MVRVSVFVFLLNSLASALVRNSIEAMKIDGVDEIVLETEYDNQAALSLYESLGFIREKRLYRFYLNGKDAFRLVLALPPRSSDSDRYSDSSSSLSEQLRYHTAQLTFYPDDDNEVSLR